ncbi:MAG: glycosyltransferase family 4 protein [Patescibacteria group bacterium]|nr:glycosyltransferase family 4 protein [Patescibacteria group bacterium]MDD4443874.1 glycosyltransferase family 4 protein [Patescibacteria group bacterium]
MKIAQIVCAYPPYAGGIGSSAYKLYELLKNDYEIINFSPQNTKTWLKKGHGAVLFSLLRDLKKFDLIYLHYPFFGTAEIIWLFKIIHPQTRLIIHYHMDVKNSSFLNKLLSVPSRLIRNSLLNKAEIIVSASLDYIKHSEIKKFYQRFPEKFREVPFFIDTDKFKPQELDLPSQNRIIAKTKDLIKQVNRLFIKRDKFDLIFIGGLDKAHYFKGVPVLLEALSLILEHRWRLNIIGSGDKEDDYKNLAKSLGLEKNVNFLGKLSEPDLIKTLQKSDALVLPSINNNEAFGIVLIEALACGIPVIASDLPGVRKVFTNKKEGLLVKASSQDDLKEKIEFLINNEKIRIEMGKMARILAEKKYSPKNSKEIYENLFNK